MAAEQTAWLQSNGVPQTESDAKYIWFENPTCSVVGLFTGRISDSNGLVTAFEASRDATCIDNIVGVILDKTSFYYESGGQIYDTGVLKVNDHDILLHVTNTQSYGGYVVHIGTVAPGAFIRVGDKVSCHVDYERRGLIAPNHTMTHVLNYAIRQVLVGVTADGTSGAAQCDQKGSLVDADKLRFDFSWGSALTISQLTQIEKKVQDIISKSLPVFAQKVPLSDAFEINSLRAIFGEQYPDPVRVISVGNDVGDLLADPNNSAWAGNSIEFCGGTHLTNTSQAVDFVLVEESGIAKGVRRITGMTKKGATEARTAATLLLNRLDDMLKMEGCKELLVASKAIKVEVQFGCFVMYGSHLLIDYMCCRLIVL